ncbi:unnamed protein product [Schistosoma bovis]|nr:unnamed protein product [Schistosoma bovis]
MVIFTFCLFILRIYLVKSGDFNDLILIDQPELLSRLPLSRSWDLFLQNPYEGTVEISESPVDKFQILINITGSHLSDEERLKYRLRSTEDSLFVALYPQFSSPAHRNDGEEEKIYLQLLCVTIISLVLVVFVVSIIFSCWWTKSYKIPIDLGITDADWEQYWGRTGISEACQLVEFRVANARFTILTTICETKWNLATSITPYNKKYQLF